MADSDSRGSEFLECDFSRADLSGAELSDTTFGKGTDLHGANIAFADLSGAFFEPSDVTGIVPFHATGLDKIRFVVPTAVIALRKSCRDNGLNIAKGLRPLKSPGEALVTMLHQPQDLRDGFSELRG